jgi:hypothetical protein
MTFHQRARMLLVLAMGSRPTVKTRNASRNSITVKPRSGGWAGKTPPAAREVDALRRAVMGNSECDALSSD